MKKYYIHYTLDFGNTYELLYCECEADYAALPDDAKRITRREAEQYCRAENKRRRDDPMFSGFATNQILPAAGDYDPCGDLVPGYIVPRTRYAAK